LRLPKRLIQASGIGVLSEFRRSEASDGRVRDRHRAFPTSARHGLGRRQLDFGGWMIDLVERCHLAWDVARIAPGRQLQKRL
jgi:hypothetical protein